jgi:predicted ester cyclase
MSDAGLSAANKECVRLLHDRLWRHGDTGIIDDVVAPDAVTHWTGSDGNTVDAVRTDVERYHAAFRDVHTQVDELVAEDDKVVLRWTTSGVHTGSYGRIAPTGNVITMTGVDIYRFAGGRIVEAWSMWDALDVYQQLGLVDEDIGP